MFVDLFIDFIRIYRTGQIKIFVLTIFLVAAGLDQSRIVQTRLKIALLVAKAKMGKISSVKLSLLVDVGGDGTARDGFILKDSASMQPVFLDIVFASFISISPGQRFALIIRDRLGLDPIYDLHVLDLHTGYLFRLHTMALGLTSLQKVNWIGDGVVEYEARILNSELRSENTFLPTVSLEKIRLRFEGSDDNLFVDLKMEAK